MNGGLTFTYGQDDDVQLELQDDSTPPRLFPRDAPTPLRPEAPKILERVFPGSILETFVVVYDLVMYALNNARTILSQGTRESLP